MTQEIITYLIIAAAVSAALVKLFKRFFRKKKKEKCSDPVTLNNSGCSGCGVNCPVRQAPFSQTGKTINP